MCSCSSYSPTINTGSTQAGNKQTKSKHVQNRKQKGSKVFQLNLKPNLRRRARIDRTKVNYNEYIKNLNRVILIIIIIIIIKLKNNVCGM